VTEPATPPARPRTASPHSTERTWTPRRITLVVVLAIVVVFALFNLDQTNISFVFFDVNAPLFIVIVAILAVGFALGYFFRGVRTRSPEST
jgi:uncharacterized integral membrane protein